ncbi:MAG TPA: pitrilysin family protein [Chthoniobacterales bacterium]|jgi:zinc protease
MKPFLFLIALMFSISESLAQASPALTIPERNVQKWVLQNGLTIIVEEDHSSPVASVQAWCQTGSIHEDKLVGAGMSHILEHMLFKGTKTRPPGKIALEVQDEGGYINAYTSFDRTVYWIEVPKSGVEKAIDILADASVNATLPEAEYTKEQEVIRREFAMGYDNPDRMTSLLLFSTAYQVHPYTYPVIGHMSVYNTLTRDDVMRYYKARYVPNNLTFVIVGDVDGEKIRTQLEQFYQNYPRVALPPVFIPTEPPQLGKREVHQEFPTELSRLMLAWHVPGLDHPDIPALDVMATVMGEGRTGRLYRQLRENKGLVFSVSSSVYSPAHPGLLIVSASVEPTKRIEATHAIEGMFEEIANNGITDAELDRAKKIFLASTIGGLTTTKGRASDLGSSWLIAKNLDFSRGYVDAINRVTKEQVREVAAKYLTEKNQTVVSLNPQGSLKSATTVDTSAKAKPIQKFTLSNGLRLLVREDSRLPLVSATAVFKAGLLVETPETAGLSRLFASVLTKGTATRTAEQIAESIESVGGSISSESGNNSFALNVEAPKTDLTLIVDLLSDVLKNPSFPEPIISREKDSLFAAQKAEKEQVTAVARDLLRSTLFPNHPYGLRASGTPESVTAAAREHLVAYHQQYCVGENGVIAIFGDVNAEEVRALAEKQLASLPKGAPALLQPPQPPPLAVEASVEKIEPRAQAILMIGYPSIDLYSPDKPALDLIDEASNDLGSRFFVTIRDNLGLAYFVGSNQLSGLSPGAFSFYLGTDPKKVNDVRTAMLGEIQKLASEGLTEAELNRAKKKLLGQQAIQNQSNDALAYSCALNELYNLGFDYYLGTEARINAVTVEDTKRVAQKYFLTKPRVIATVQPAAK